MNQNLIDQKREIDRFLFINGDTKILLSAIDKASTQKNQKGYMSEQYNLIYI